MRYIDDLIFIWKGSQEEFNLFRDNININDWGLEFSGETNTESINYLDITLFHEGSNILTKNYFKKVDCNNLLEFESCHFKKWKTKRTV